jgi:Peptidase family M28
VIESTTRRLFEQSRMIQATLSRTSRIILFNETRGEYAQQLPVPPQKEREITSVYNVTTQFRTRAVLALLSLLPPVALSGGEPLNVRLVKEQILDSRLATGQVPNNKREETVADLFREVGCPVETRRVNRKADNVICTLPGSGTDTIVVGAHFDFVSEGQGIIDDWSGTPLLPSLYQALKDQQRKHTFLFIAFANEVEGMVGSRSYVRSLDQEQVASIRAFVNLECLGTSPTKVWMHRSTPELVQSLNQIAIALKNPIEGMNVEQVGDDDTHPFLDAKVPVISIHSINEKTFGYLHSKADNMGPIESGDYHDSYKLIAFFLAYLDRGK